MPNFLICGVALENPTFYKVSMICDSIILIITLVAYFSNELAINGIMAILCLFLSISFVIIIIMAGTAHLVGINNF